MPESCWQVPVTDGQKVAAISSALRIGPIAAAVLVHRGLDELAAARRFLQPSLDELHDPFTMRDMPRAVERLRAAISGGEKILIYGDYDVDGTTSVVLRTKA